MTLPPEADAALFRARYVTITTDPRQSWPTDFEQLNWKEVDLETEARSVDHGPEAPARVPTYRACKRLLVPLFPGRSYEHVSVNWRNGRTDMFVDEFGAPECDNMPVNVGATLIYWTASILQGLQMRGGIETRAEYPARQFEALKIAAGMLAETEHRSTPRIHGPAVLFDQRVWY